MNTQEAFNVIKRTIDLALQSGVIKSIEDSKLVFDSLDSLYKLVEQSNKSLHKAETKEEKAESKEEKVHELKSK